VTRQSGMWLFYALIGPASWALLNHLDKYLLGRFFKDDAAGPALVVFTGFAGIAISIAILLSGAPVLALAPRQIFSVMGAGALLIASLIPYMIAMQRNEASIVASLYRLTPLFTFALSYAALGENLRLTQIFGGLLIILGAILLILDLEKGARRLDLPTFFLMCAACLMNACTVVIFKFVALESSFWSSAFWEYLGAGIFATIIAFGISPYRHALLALLHSRGAYFLVPVTLSGDALNLSANLAVNFAGLMAPLALVSIVSGLHPLFLFAYGILFTLFLPKFGRERLLRRQILQKVAAMAVMGAGLVTTFT